MKHKIKDYIFQNLLHPCKQFRWVEYIAMSGKLPQTVFSHFNLFTPKAITSFSEFLNTNTSCSCCIFDRFLNQWTAAWGVCNNPLFTFVSPIFAFEGKLKMGANYVSDFDGAIFREIHIYKF